MQMLGVADLVDLDDAAVGDREHHGTANLPAAHEREPDAVADEGEPCASSAAAHPTRDRVGSVHLGSGAHAERVGVWPEHDRGIEHREETVEVATTRRREERLAD